MFSGIIEEIGTIKNIAVNRDSMQLTIGANLVLQNSKLGDSIAVNGTCLTVIQINSMQFCVDVIPETFNTTSLKLLKNSSSVNLERSLALGDRIGGHFISGHVDTTGTINKITPHNNAIYYKIIFPANYRKYCIDRGSIAVDGTSLTIFELGNDYLVISLIPHTVENTILKHKKIGDLVNLEFDMLGKYAENQLNPSVGSTNSKIDFNFLNEHGFI